MPEHRPQTDVEEPRQKPDTVVEEAWAVAVAVAVAAAAAVAVAVAVVVKRTPHRSA